MKELRTLAKFNLKEYAKRGAQARIDELHEELNEIYSRFPDLRRAGRKALKGVAATLGLRTRRRKRPAMTVAQRKAISGRMKKYWSARRKAKNSKG